MKEIFEKLENFDKKHGWDWYNNISNDKERLEVLEKEIINILGELGELANETKKQRRKEIYNSENLKEETTDMFIFLLKIAKTLDMDLEKEFYKKMKFNEERFREHLN